MKNSFFLAAKTALYTIIVLSLFIACSNSVSSDEHEHEEPAGFRLKMNGQTVVEQLPSKTLTGSFSLAVGEDTPLISLFFIAEDGDEFLPDEPEYSLKANFTDSTIAEFEQHEEDGKWKFHIHAKAAGSTNLNLQLLHNGHSDFDMQAISILVNASK